MKAFIHALSGSRQAPLYLLGMALIASSAFGEKEGNRFHPVISYTPPLDSNDFANWNL